MYYSDNIKNFFISVTIVVIGSICFFKIGTIDMHSLWAVAKTLIPAVIVMGILGSKIGDIVDNPRNKADADYKVAVLNALKKMDKSMTLQELNEKLTKQVAEPDLPDDEEDDVDE